MKRVFCFFTILLLMPVPILAADYEPVSYISSGVQIDVHIEAGTPWSSPFTESVNVSIGVVPLEDEITQTNITTVSLVVNRVEADGSGYSLISAEEDIGAPLVEGGSYANYSHQFSLSGTAGGLECYFSLLVRGVFSNATFQQNFQALGPENLVGPFQIATGISSPVAWVGLIVIAISSVVFIAGVYGVKKSRTRRRRRSLMDE